jgi:molecular chaperone HtpG
MSVELTTAAEQNAKKAETLPAFGGLNLIHIKRSVASLIGQIGRGSIFDEYTKHDITHIDEMLRNLDWIIPDSTKKIMSDADWLMIVLATYFHDMGMLVTKDEFEARTTTGSGFPIFCEQVLFAGTNGPSYKAKINKLSSDNRDRFLYQEFVRSKHAERIRTWIGGQANHQLGITPNVLQEVTKLLEPLGLQFRRDLGIVCESHHLNDLGELQKYKVSQPYGNSDAETVNLQYCAVLLRTADLLHITSDRTPSVEFRTINPNDPLSQQEWAKQMAVTRIRPKWGLSEDGQPDENAPRDTVEVHAYFTNEDGFFGLTSYLAYAAEQIKKSNDWISQTVKQRLAKHEFPWRRIDDSNIETEGFIRDAFEFTMDQAKILDLLTGHTLYNDTNVVLRELVQNAIDAIRLKHFPKSPADSGQVSIVWNSKTRVLSVQDNGTGMTQAIINNFLLKVGSSQYQDQEFKKKNPTFSSISRFGIGVLSTFMIADSVEVVTCHPDDEQARRLILRDVHGKYLIRLLDKGSGDPQAIGPNGTIFRLQIRPGIELPNILQTAQHWVVVPDCNVTVQLDDTAPQRVGFSSTADALRGLLKSTGLDHYEDGIEEPKSGSLRIRIVENEQNGVTMACALWWSKWFKEWSFLTLNMLPDMRRSDNEKPPLLLGICVEGIRIVTDTPGFEGHSIVALANTRGPSAPKTNVARSGLEVTQELTAMLGTIYSMYANHVTSELSDLTSKQSFSLTWATGETAYLLAPLLRDQREVVPLNRRLLLEALQTIPCILIEVDGKRKARSPKDLSKIEELWTIDSNILSSAEALIREVASAASLSELVKALNVSDFKFPNAPVVCGIDYRNQNNLVRAVFEKKEIDQIIVDSEQRRVDLRWVESANPPRWIELPVEFRRLAYDIADRREEDFRRRGGYVVGLPQVPDDRVVACVPSGEIAVSTNGVTYLLPGTDITRFARDRLNYVRKHPSIDSAMVAIVVLSVIAQQLYTGKITIEPEAVGKLVRSYDRYADHLLTSKRIEEMFDCAEFISLMTRTQWRSYDLSKWRRREMELE